jgi:ferrochelatase
MNLTKTLNIPHRQTFHTGILIVNLGTPNAPTPLAIRRYLAEFLWDSRIVEIPHIIWWPILHGIILRLKPARAARKYRAIWTQSGSPLLIISKRQKNAIEVALTELYPAGSIKIALGMRYGTPSIAAALAELRAAGVRRMLILPLYPQYSSTTTASTFDAVAAELRTWRLLPELRFISQYYNNSSYLNALADSIRNANNELSSDRLLFSFHGLPISNVFAGDPYYCQCHKTASLVAKLLNLKSYKWAVSFQSRFGYTKWLQPYTSDILTSWAKIGIETVDVICPGFSADCLETLEEIAIENKKIFLNAGGINYRYIPALNDTPSHIAALTELIRINILGWL